MRRCSSLDSPLFKSDGIFYFKHNKTDTYTLSIDLNNYKHQDEVFCDMYTTFDKSKLS